MGSMIATDTHIAFRDVLQLDEVEAARKSAP
jgi:hypothetical protein